ncbi:phage tail protein [Xenorhabdus griffiniae]|uniref:phage tail protein n=1 Tax=Xenorhabdus griffiniae TaxID=351672 RepID=UPI0030CCE423
MKNLGLTAGSALPVGVPIPWPLATPPAGWMQCNGATFTAAQYPELARVYPSLTLPDLRGKFLRGWNGDTGDDAGRELLSIQIDAIQNIVGTFGRTQLFQGVSASGPFTQLGHVLSSGLTPSTEITGYGAVNWIFDASRAVRTAMETRPINIAFNYIVRAV